VRKAQYDSPYYNANTASVPEAIPNGKTGCSNKTGLHTVIERGTPKLGSFKQICAKLHKGGDCVYAMVHWVSPNGNDGTIKCHHGSK
jgi:hypothetical protein